MCYERRARQVADNLDRLGFPTFASSLRAHPEDAGIITSDFIGNVPEQVTKGPRARNFAEGKALLLRFLRENIA